MKCHLCKENKLSREFPFCPLTDNCSHPLLHCLDCATASVKRNNKCSQCENTVTEENEIYKEYLETLDFLFPPEVENKGSAGYQAESAVVFGSGNVYVTTISGEAVTLSYQSLKRIVNIKKEVENELKIPPEKQRLLFRNKELQVRNEGGRMLTLKDHNVPSESTLHLIIVLCAVPDELDKAVFDFYWGLPPGKSKDYLDVSVLVYSGRENIGIINYNEPQLNCCPEGVEHSGRAKMYYGRREGRREGRHQVKLNLKVLPHHIDKLVFTLSAWGSSSVSKYPYYRLNFYDVNFPDQQLCSDTVDVHLKDYKSIIMCCLSKRNGRWEVIDIKRGSAGFTRNYRPLKREIDTVIRYGWF